ncbi:MAG: DUF4167 domain-containing protein [Devosiaceae bacterium]
MRPGQSNNKRGRGRGGRKGPSPLSRSYESNGPDVKIRGTAQHIADKYINLARDAQSSGDTVLSEAYFQHAEHFYRIVAAAQQQMNQNVNVKRADDPLDAEEGDENGEFDPSDPNAPQPEGAANGSGENRREQRARDDEDGDGERRPRRNRGRQRRGRGEDGRGDDTRDQNREGAREDNRDAARRDDSRSEAARADSPSEAPNQASDAPQAQADVQPEAERVEKSADATEAKPRRAPRQRKASVPVEDRFTDEGSSGDAAAAPEPPKPVSLGDDVAPVQAAPDES